MTPTAIDGRRAGGPPPSGAGPTTTARQIAAGPRTLGAAVRRFYRHASPRFLTAVVLTLLAVRIAVGGASLWDVVVVAAIVAFWPVLEWLIHVFVLHSRPFAIGGRTIDLAVPRKHRAHHRDPWNLNILFIPLQGFAFSIPVLLLLSFVLLPTRELALTAALAFLAMGLRYEWIHFLIHTPYRPRSRRYERLWRNHRLHHCKNEHYWFGVSMLSGDRLLGTQPRVRDVPTSPTCRALEEAGRSGA
ncbi:MAG: sterol desaturase family protein [Deltaproteobacteria bacterium]|nr:MAG: sterol desaturase family protein [Deltaproteobacteria bacterium]